MGFDVYYIEKNDYTCAVFLISHECKRAWIYFSELSIWMLAAILTISGATMLTGCSKADSPVDAVKPDVKMSDVLGEWIFEYDGGSVTPIPVSEKER